MLSFFMYGPANPLSPLLAADPRNSFFPLERLAEYKRLTLFSRPWIDLFGRLTPLFATHPQNALVTPLFATHFPKNFSSAVRLATIHESPRSPTLPLRKLMTYHLNLDLHLTQVAAHPTRCDNPSFHAPVSGGVRLLYSPRATRHSPLSLGDLCHSVTPGSKNAKPAKPALTARETCPRCTSPAKASSPKKWPTSPNAKRSSRNSCAAKSPAAAPSSPPTSTTAISNRWASASPLSAKSMRTSATPPPPPTLTKS